MKWQDWITCIQSRTLQATVNYIIIAEHQCNRTHTTVNQQRRELKSLMYEIQNNINIIIL